MTQKHDVATSKLQGAKLSACVIFLEQRVRERGRSAINQVHPPLRFTFHSLDSHPVAQTGWRFHLVDVVVVVVVFSFTSIVFSTSTVYGVFGLLCQASHPGSPSIFSTAALASSSTSNSMNPKPRCVFATWSFGRFTFGNATQGMEGRTYL